LGYTVEDLRALAQRVLASGPSARATMAEVKAEARRRMSAIPARRLIVRDIRRTDRANEDLIESGRP